MSDTLHAMATDARLAARYCAEIDATTRDAALHCMAQALRAFSPEILAQNERDMATAQTECRSDAYLDRLQLTDDRIESMAQGLESIATLPDPLGKVLEQRTLESGIRLSRISVPLGVVGIIYEARPNVTSDAAGICVKSGNACILRGGSGAFYSNRMIARTLDRAACAAGLPSHLIQMVETIDRSATDEMLHLHGLVDVIIPRGGSGLIHHCVENSSVPVIETGLGNCHIYVHKDADLSIAVPIVINAKCQRPGVCNAAESLLVDRSIADQALPLLFDALTSHNVTMHVDEATAKQAQRCGVAFVAATEDDWAKEYLGLEMSIKIVDGIDEAIDHINRYGTGHSESIVTMNTKASQLFSQRVDAAVVYTNASTRFTDGGLFGFGAEIGISTQKLHVRGPFAVDALTTYKYVMQGSGQVRA
jgi:glutamate-5-semialdehyde dehydrogenase